MEPERRGILRWIGLSAAAGTVSPAFTAWGERRRILDGSRTGDALLDGDAASPELSQFLRSVRLSQVQSRAGLSVVWLTGEPAAPPLEVATLEEGRAQGVLHIAERERATVPELIVDNRGGTFVLLLAGEILLGGKQNRIVTEDVLLPPKSGPRDISVYCVEQGRWAGARPGFESRGTFAAPSLRSQVMAKQGQNRVWAEVDRYSALAASPSPTRSYQDVYEKPEVQEHIRDVEQRIGPFKGALGAAVFVDDALAGLDLFQDGSLFAREWPKLLRAYAVEVYRRSPRSGGDERRLRDTVADVLRNAEGVRGTLRRNAGVGELFEFRAGPHRGTSLAFQGHVTHVAIL